MSDILVIGATGKTGRRLIPLLAAAGHRVREASRTPSVATGVRFDWDDPATHGPALRGADAVYVIPPELRLDHDPQVIDLLGRARTAGVRRAVVLSARGVDLGPDNALIRIERALPGTGLEWTVLRPTWFAQNFTEGPLAPGPHTGGAIVSATGDGRTPLVSTADIAAVAAAALTGDGHAGRVYELTGPEALSFGDAARILSRHAGAEIRHVAVEPEAYRDAMTGMGVPPDYAAMLAGLMEVVSGGHDAHLSDDVRRVLGRPPESFEQVAAREAAVPATA